MKKENKKGGRPPLGKKRLGKTFSCRLSDSEYEKLWHDAQKSNMKLSVLGRKYLVDGIVYSIFSDEEQTEKRQLIGIRNNLNQLVKLAHIGGFRSQFIQLNEQLKQIDEILNRYQNVSKSKPSR